jgi:anaerobic magnesium-protoporphyrin IX monomethyl ester cyclase
MDVEPRVAIVFPYFRTRAPTELLFPPLGPAALAAQLRRLEVEARVFDCTFSTLEELRAGLAEYRPAIVGLSVMVSLTASAARVAEMVRAELPDALLVAGGPLPTVFPGRFTPYAGAVFRGEADLSFPQFCRDYLAAGATPESLGDLPLHTYDGLVVDAGGLRVSTPPVHHPESALASFPPPDRADFDHARYQREWRRGGGAAVTSIIATLGCPYECEFCSKPVFGDVVRRRDLDAVFAEIEGIRRLGYDGLWIADDLFTLDRGFLESFCRRIAGLGLSWSCLARADGIDAATARLMKRSGCRRVYLGLESGSQATLDLMKKHLTVEEGERTARAYHAAGIEVAAFFIVGYPGETPAQIEQTFRHALALPLDEISFTVPMPLPGSALFERLGRPDDGRDWQCENEVTFVYRSGIDEAWLRRRIAETTRAFAAAATAAAGTAGRSPG